MVETESYHVSGKEIGIFNKALHDLRCKPEDNPGLISPSAHSPHQIKEDKKIIPKGKAKGEEEKKFDINEIAIIESVIVSPPPSQVPVPAPEVFPGIDPEEEMQPQSVVPCDVCRRLFEFRSYEKHYLEHTKKKVPVDKKEQAANDSIPCDVCGRLIRIESYEDHTKAHSRESIIGVKAAVSAQIPCDVCQKEIEFSEYEKHMKTHEKPKLPGISSLYILDTGLIKCNFCGKDIMAKNYKAHKDEHEAPPPEELPSSESQLQRFFFNGKGKETECTICLCPYEMNDKMIFLPCMHQFHEGCCLGWIKKSPTCSICKKQIFK